MPAQTLIPLGKNIIKYGAITAGGKLLYDHTLNLYEPFTKLLEHAPDPLKSNWAQLGIGVAALGVAHFLLSQSVRRCASKDHFVKEASEPSQGAKPAESAPPPPEGQTDAPAAKGRSPAAALVAFLIAIVPKTAIAMVGGPLVINRVPLLSYIYDGLAGQILSLPGMTPIFDQGVHGHVACSAAGLVLILFGYYVVRRGIVKLHGPLHRLSIVNDRRIESLHLDTQKIRGFGMQLQTSDTEGIVGDMTPTADVYSTTYDHDGRHKDKRVATLMYIQDGEPKKTPLDKLDATVLRAVREAIAEMHPDKALSASDLERIDIERLRKIVAAKSETELSELNLGRILLALMNQGHDDISTCDEGRLLEEINDVESGYEGGLFYRAAYRKDEGGHYVRYATMAEDLTASDAQSSSPRNGYGPNYWRHGKVLMGFWIARGAGEDSGNIRMRVQQIRKSRLRRYWDWGASYRWTFRQQNFRIDECWIASYGWVIPYPGVSLRRYYEVRDSRGEIVATMREIVWAKVTFDFNWRVEIYCDRLNNDEAAYTLAMLTEFLHSRHRYVKSRTTPGNTAHERLLVGGGKKRGDATEAIGGGL